MILWLDAQLSPQLAQWICDEAGVTAIPVLALGLRDATDRDIFLAARAHDAVVMTKDRDFVHLVERLGPPPSVIWLRCGNTSNSRLQEVFRRTLDVALRAVAGGEALVEIVDSA